MLAWGGAQGAVGMRAGSEVQGGDGGVEGIEGNMFSWEGLECGRVKC